MRAASRSIGPVRRAPYFAGRSMLAATGDAEAMPADELIGAIPKELVRDDEVIILALRPSLLFIVLAPAGGLMFLLIITLLLALLAATVPWIPWAEEQAYLLGVILIGVRLLWQGLEWFNRLYILTDRRIITRSGVLRISVFETRLKSIQHTSVFRRVRERVFNLGSIGFATAGSDVFETFWVMVRQPFAVHRTIVEAIQRYGNHRN